MRYTTDEIDFLAVYIIPCQAWYIVPVASIQPVQRFISLYPHKKHSLGRLEHFREAWHLLSDSGRLTSKSFMHLPKSPRRKAAYQ